MYVNLVYKVENSKAETEFAFLLLLSLLTASVTALLFYTTQKVLTLIKKPTFIIIFLYLSKKQTKKLML